MPQTLTAGKNAVFFVVGAIAAIWSAVKFETVRRSLVESLPPQFQDDYTSRYAFSVYALSTSTPLPLQAEYMKSLWGSCVFCLYLAGLLLFSECGLRLLRVGWVLLGRFFNDQVLEDLQGKLQPFSEPRH